LPTNGVKLASTHDVEFAAYKIEGETTYAIQYHPEVSLHRRVKNARKFLVKLLRFLKILRQMLCRRYGC
jgi:GMP synthase (glutamine-hydrolysing)